MSIVIVYTKAICPYCVWAKDLLARKQIPYTEIRIDLEPSQRDEMIRLTGRQTVPQIVINNQPIGGFDDLSALDRSGELDRLLNI